MNKLALLCCAALAASNVVAPAYAASISPAVTTNLDLEGGATLVKTSLGTLSCTLKLNIDIGADIGGGLASTGTLNGGTNTGPGNCPFLTISPTTFTIISGSSAGYGSVVGRLNDLVVKLGGNTICDYDPATDPPLDFTIANLDPTGPGVEVTFGVSGPVAFSPDCSADATLYELALPEVVRAHP